MSYSNLTAATGRATSVLLLWTMLQTSLHVARDNYVRSSERAIHQSAQLKYGRYVQSLEHHLTFPMLGRMKAWSLQTKSSLVPRLHPQMEEKTKVRA